MKRILFPALAIFCLSFAAYAAENSSNASSCSMHKCQCKDHKNCGCNKEQSCSCKKEPTCGCGKEEKTDSKD